VHTRRRPAYARAAFGQDHQHRVVDRTSGRPRYGALHCGEERACGIYRAQALEWAPYGVHVNAISPGLFPDVVTSGEERARATEQRAAQTVPLRRPGRLREVGLLALYLASDASDYMTGQTIMLDGGLGL